MKYFTYLWNRDGFRSQQEFCTRVCDFTLNHAVGSEFVERGVSSGDCLFIIHLYRKQVYVLSCLQVDRIATPKEAAVHLSQDLEQLWQGAEHILANPSPIHFDKVLTMEQVNSIRYFSFTQKRYVAPKFREYGVPDSMSIRGVRQLSVASAKMLNIALSV